MAGRHQGAQVGVQRALGWRRGKEHDEAPCTYCGAPLAFSTGAYGQTLEACTRTGCPLRQPHRPVPDRSGFRDDRRRRRAGAGC